MRTITPEMSARAGRRAHKLDVAFRWLCASCTWIAVAMLFVLLGRILLEGLPHLSWSFLTNPPSRFPDRAGVLPAVLGTVSLFLITAACAVPVGVAAAIYLEEYGRDTRLSRFLETNISNLAGVPSIVYGILGLVLFVRLFSMGYVLLAGGLTLALLALPVVIVSSREALRAVPPGLRASSYALGATRWQTVSRVVLPSAIPGILTGVILSLSRAIGETAPLILVGAATFIMAGPRSPFDEYTALPIQIYDWATRPQPEFQDLAAGAIIVLLVILLTLNSVAIYFRQRFIQKLKG